MNNKLKITSFDICLMNPPYGSVGGDTLHLKFVNKVLNIAKQQISIFPFTFATKVNHKPSKKYKETFDKYLTEIQEEDYKQFSGTTMPNVAIYVFDSNKKDDSIKLIKANKNTETIKSLFDISEFNDYEQKIVSYLEKHNTQKNIWAGGNTKRNKELEKIPKEKHKDFLNDKIVASCKQLKNLLNNEYSTGLIVNQSNGGMNGMALSKHNGQIFDNYNDFEAFFLNRNISNGYRIILFNTIKAAENCKVALQNPLLRFTIYRMQDDQQMHDRVYKYIPAIDWEDDRVKTDEGLLEVCGCPKDKCKEYADYCKKIIDKVDEN